jgi:hypothetical protein
MVPITIVNGVYKPSYNWGPHIVPWDIQTDPNVKLWGNDKKKLDHDQTLSVVEPAMSKNRVQVTTGRISGWKSIRKSMASMHMTGGSPHWVKVGYDQSYKWVG